MSADGWDKKPNDWENIDFKYKNLIKNDINLINDVNLDGIFVLAGGINDKGLCHPWVINRLNLAYKIYTKTNSKIFCIGGGTYHKPPILNKRKFAIHESTSCAEYLINLGVNSKNIYKEWSSYDTIANGFFSFTNFIIPLKLKKIILITSAFHMNRSKLIFEWFKNIFDSNVEMIFIEASDENIDTDIIKIRTEREKKSSENLKINVINKLKTIEDVHKWFFTEHKAYCSNSELLRVDLLNEQQKKSY